MKFLISILLLSCSFSSSGAILGSTNCIGLEVENNGWVLRATVGGDVVGSIGTNGNFFSGLTKRAFVSGPTFSNYNYVTTGPTNALTLTVTSMGFDDNGIGIQVTRTIYGTQILRLPYPSNQSLPTNDIQWQDLVLGTNVVFRIALSDYIYAKDSNITANALGGWLSGTNGTVTNVAAVVSMSVTNSSTNDYPKCIANWTWPGGERITNGTLTLRAVGFQKFAQQGRPVRLMTFTTADTHSNTKSVTNRVMQVDRAMQDALPFSEYIGAIDVSAFTNSDVVTCNFKAYPWIGDAQACLDSSDGVNTAPSPYYCPQLNLCDRLQTYGGAWAIVATNGSDTTGVAQTNPVVSWTNAFLTIAGAAHAIAGTNFWALGHADVGGATIYMSSGNYMWMGASANYSNASKCNLIITAYPTNTDWSMVNITNGTGDDHIKDYMKFSKIWITTTKAVNFTGCTNLWFDQCMFNETGASITFYDQGYWNMTRCIVTNIAQGMRAYSTKISPLCITRGNYVRVAGDLQMYAYTFCGNDCVVTGSAALEDYYTSIPIPTKGGNIAYNNLLLACGNASSSCVQFASTNLHGCAFIQNVIEYTNSVSNPVMQFWADSITNQARNVLVWHNVGTGNRCNYNYDEVGSTGVERSQFSLQNCLFDDYNLKADGFAPANAGRIGNWASQFSVGSRAYIDAEMVGIGAAGLCNDFDGVNCLQTHKGAQATTNTFFRYTSAAGYNGFVKGAGYGNYRLKSQSPVFQLPAQWLIPTDLDGAPRGAIDPPGAYVAGNPKKSLF